MLRYTRVVLAAVLAIAVAAVPLILDQCSAACEAHHESAASAPSCLHAATPTAVHVRHAPSSCGHDHDGSLITSDNGVTATSRPLVTNVAALAIYIRPAIAISQGLRPDAPPGTASTLLDRSSLPLRI
jgi:hypothetical protein